MVDYEYGGKKAAEDVAFQSSRSVIVVDVIVLEMGF